MASAGSAMSKLNCLLETSRATRILVLKSSSSVSKVDSSDFFSARADHSL